MFTLKQTVNLTRKATINFFPSDKNKAMDEGRYVCNCNILSFLLNSD